MSENQNPYTIHSGDEFGGCEWYSVLKGPDGFECWLTEPEDRNWWREGQEVVVQLNAYHTENARLKAKLEKIQAILEEAA